VAKTLSEFKAKHDPETIIKGLQAELRSAQAQSATAAAVKEYIGTLQMQLGEAETPDWVSDLPTGAKSPGTPTLFLSDLHWGEVVHPSQIGGVNAYNLTIARKRMKFTLETAIKLLRILDPQMRYPGIVLPLGGDMVSGNIHDELAATNEINSMPTLLDLYRHLVPGIRLMADTFGHVFLPCVTGNHDRDTKKTWSKDRYATSFSWLLYQFLAIAFADDKRVTFYIPDGADAIYKVHNLRYLLTHGDQFKAGDSIIGPIGPLMRGNQKKSARNSAVGQDYDVMICGHWHQYIQLNRLIVNGSMKGYDEYAAQGNFSFEPPTQALWMTHPDYGITYRMPVFCDSITKRVKTPWVSVPKAPTLH
jgi:predicted phosphodiesterase